MTQLHYMTWVNVVLRWHWTKIPACCLSQEPSRYIVSTRAACIANFNPHMQSKLKYQAWLERYDKSAKPPKIFLIATNSILTVSGKNKLSCSIASVQTNNTLRVKNRTQPSKFRFIKFRIKPFSCERFRSIMKHKMENKLSGCSFYQHELFTFQIFFF